MPKTKNSKPRILLCYRSFASSYSYLPWLLRNSDLAVDVIASLTHPTQYSNFISYFASFNETDEGFIEQLQKCTQSEDYLMMILMDENARSLAYKIRQNPNIQRLLPFPIESDLNNIVQDKAKFYNWCNQQGITTPRSEIASNFDEVSILANELGFPLVLKNPKGMGGQGVVIVQSPDLLAEDFNRVDTQDSLVVQQYVNGTVGSTLFLSVKGELLTYISSEKTVPLKGGLGPSAIKRIHDTPTIEPLCRRIAQSSQVTGITGFDWMRNERGEYFVIDPHLGRCTPSVALIEYSSIDLGEVLRMHFDKNSNSITIHPKPSDLLVALFPQVIELIFQGGFFQLIKVANPLKDNVRYFFGPLSEWRMTLKLLSSYTSSNLRVIAGRLRAKFFPSTP